MLQNFEGEQEKSDPIMDRLDAKLQEWNVAEKEVDQIINEWGNELHETIRNREDRGEGGIVAKYQPLIHAAREKANLLFDEWLSLAKEAGN